MPNSIWINGRHEWIEGPEAFALIVDEKLGRDAADLFRSYLKMGTGESAKSAIEEALVNLRDVEPADDYCSDINLECAIDILEELIRR